MIDMLVPEQGQHEHFRPTRSTATPAFWPPPRMCTSRYPGRSSEAAVHADGQRQDHRRRGLQLDDLVDLRGGNRSGNVYQLRAGDDYRVTAARHGGIHRIRGRDPGVVVGQSATHDPGSIYNVDTLVDPMQRWWQWGESLTWEHEFGDFNVRYIGASRDYRMDNIWPLNPVPTPQQVAGWGTGTSELTQELQVLSAPSSPIQWVGGVLFLHNTVKYLSPFFIEGTSISGTNGEAPFSRINFTGEQSTISYAPYGQMTAPLPFLGRRI